MYIYIYIYCFLSVAGSQAQVTPYLSLYTYIHIDR